MYVIGLISGTSVDGIDAVLVKIAGTTDDLAVDLIAANTYPYPTELRSQILAVCAGSALSMVELAELDDAIATVFAQAALAVQAGLGQNQPPAVLIGSHGQTVYHRPPQPTHPSSKPLPSSLFPLPSSLSPVPSSPLGYSLQLGRGALIAHLTDITTVSNFRAADIAVGGHGAPLVSPVDVCLLRHPQYDRCVQNIGGISNVTYLPASKADGNPNLASDAPEAAISHSGIVGWDTGPGNTLLDLAVQRLSEGQRSFDQDGAWAAQGSPCLELVHHWLQQEYFQQRPPKSTGRELFGRHYLDRCLQDATRYNLSHADVLATLTELTAASIAHSYRSFLPHMPDQVLVCGGGSRNQYLKQRLQANLNPATVYTTDEMGLNADYKEAIAFAVLAYWRMNQIPGNLPEVTGARQAVLLGEIHLAV